MKNRRYRNHEIKKHNIHNKKNVCSQKYGRNINKQRGGEQIQSIRNDQNENRLLSTNENNKKLPNRIRRKVRSTIKFILNYAKNY